MNAIGLTVVVLLCCFTGLVIFARYHDCDPVTNKVFPSGFPHGSHNVIEFAKIT